LKKLIPGQLPYAVFVAIMSPLEANPAGDWCTLAEFTYASEPGHERRVSEQVAAAVAPLQLSTHLLKRLKTVVAETAMNAMEHGNQYRPELPVTVRVLVSQTALAVQISDYGGGPPIPAALTPDLEAKLAGQETPRGWGLYLIEQMVDEMHLSSDENRQTVELILYLEKE
jgi:anti-sigma regulatory factor (Ser/Thr protein kinase)